MITFLFLHNFLLSLDLKNHFLFFLVFCVPITDISSKSDRGVILSQHIQTQQKTLPYHFFSRKHPSQSSLFSSNLGILSIDCNNCHPGTSLSCHFRNCPHSALSCQIFCILALKSSSSVMYSFWWNKSSRSILCMRGKFENVNI